MASPETENFLAGVIEGFYGQPWTQAERFELFDWMADWGLNTYLYAPKDDLKHRAIWRELYSTAESEALKQLIDGCRQRNIRFVYALSPGLDIRYSDEAELNQLRKCFEQMLILGCQHFALLFDDIPDRLDHADIQRWGSLASAQCHVTNALFEWTREREPSARFLFCPTPYCGRMVRQKHGGENYLETIGRELLPEIDVFWTGPEIISREITVEHIERVRQVLRRKPLIWDNLHANDYDGRRFFCGPYARRPPELRNVVSGLLSNPNTEFPLNCIPIRTLAEFVHCDGTWDARKAYFSTMREWLPRFATMAQPITFDDLTLFFDCYYLPHEEGPEAEALYQLAHSLLARNPEAWNVEEVESFRRQSTRLRELCIRLTEVRHRPLFYALSRRIWELREELDLLEQFIERNREGKRANIPSLTSHLPGTYRGGMVARLQRLLVPQADGTFTPASARPALVVETP